MMDSVIAGGLTLPAFFLCIGAAMLLGIFNAMVFTYKSRHTASLALTLALLPSVVAVVIMLVNGNVGTGVAVAGAFALVRFRSMPGTAREIAGIFVSMVLGLAAGMGYVALAAVFMLLTAVFLLLLTALHFGEDTGKGRQLKITIPENLDYDGLFDDVFAQYANAWELERVKTTNMGTLYELTYFVSLKQARIAKAFLDEIRSRNGNLNVVCGRMGDRETL